MSLCGVTRVQWVNMVIISFYNGLSSIHHQTIIWVWLNTVAADALVVKYQAISITVLPEYFFYLTSLEFI